MLNRRAFLYGSFVASLAGTQAALAQQATRVYRLGLLVNLPSPPAPVATGFYEPFYAYEAPSLPQVLKEIRASIAPWSSRRGDA